MAAKPLTKAEKAWLKQLQDVINKCPSTRLAAFTTGDDDITLYDSDFDDQINELMDRGASDTDFCVAARDCDAILADITFPFPIHSTSG